jgi:predicted RNA polymerase sigma factor
MLLTDARRPARCAPDGSVIPLEEQDRTLWDASAIREGISLVSRSLTAAKIGPYQLQAAIAAVHAEASKASDTDWRQILALYLVLERYAPTPIVRLNRAVATAMVHGPQAGLDLLASVESDSRTATYHRLAAVRAHMLEMAGDLEAAQRDYLLAARRTTSLPERRYLELRAARAGADRRPTA